MAPNRSVHIHVEVGFGKGGENNVEYNVDGQDDRGQSAKDILEGVFGEFVGFGLGLGTESKIAEVNEKDKNDKLFEERKAQAASEQESAAVAPIEEELVQEVAPPQLAGFEGDE